MRSLWLLFLVGLTTGFVSEKLFVSSQTSFSTADDLYLEDQTSGDLPIDDEDDAEDDGSGSGSGDYSLSDADTEEILRRFLNFSNTLSKEVVPSQPQPTAGSPQEPPTTAADGQPPPTTVKTTAVIVTDGDSRDQEVAPTGPTADWNASPSSTSETAAPELGIDISATQEADEDNSLDTWDLSTPKDSDVNIQIQEIDNEIVAKEGRGSRIYEMDSPKEVTSENLWERTEVLAAVIACGVVGFLCAVFLLLLLAYRMKKKDEGSYDLGDTKLSTTTYHKAPTKEFYA